MIASFCMTLSCGHGISTTAGAVRRCHFFILFILPDKSRDVLEGYGGFLRRFPTMSQSPAAALLRAAKTPPGSWLDLDLLKIYYGESSSCPWPLRIRGSAVWDARGPGVDRRPPDFFFPVTAVAGCQQRKCDIICSKLSAHTKWHKAAHTSRCSDKQPQLPVENCT